MLRVIANNLVYNIFSFAVRTLIGLVLTPFLISHLGRESYGVWILSSSFWVGGLLSSLDLGIQAATTKYVAEYDAHGEERRIAELIQAATAAYLVLGGIGCMLVNLLRWNWFERIFTVPPAQIASAKALLGLVAVQLVFDFCGLGFNGTLEGFRRYDLSRMLEIGHAVAFAVSALFLLRHGYGVVALGTALLAITAARVLVALVLTRRFCPSWRFSDPVRPTVFRAIAGYSGKILLVRLNALVYNNMDRMIIAILLTSTLLANYDVAYRVYALALVSLSFVSQLVVSPAAWFEAKGDQAGLERMKLWATKTTVAACIPIVIATMVLAKPLIGNWVGPAFVVNARDAQLFISYLLIWALLPVGYNILIGVGRISELLRVQIPLTLLNLTLSILLAPRIGIRGVIVGTVVSELLTAVFYLPMFFGTSWKAWRTVLKGVIAPTYPLAAVNGLLLAACVTLRRPDDLMETVAYWVGSVTLFWVLYAAFGLNGDEWRTLDSMSGNRLRRVPIVRDLVGWKLRHGT